MMPPGVVSSDGPDAALLCSEYWFVPDPWQEGLLYDWLARDERGRLMVISAGLSVPRQNGKNGALEALEFYLLVTDGTTHILHTAHRVKTVKRAFNRLAKVFTRKGAKWRAIRAMVRTIRRTNGEEAIELTNGATIEYSARSKSGGRGFENITLVVYDEAQELTDDQLEAINATLSASASGDRQAIYTGTPPGPNVFGTVFKKRRRTALESPTARMCWHEWSVEERPGDDAEFADVLDAIYATNPAMGTRLDIEFTEEEWGTYSKEGFARERLGWWDPAAEAQDPPAIPPEAWEASAIDAIARRYQGVMCLGVKFSADGSQWALAGCKARRDRSRYAFELVELGDTSRGTRPLAQALAARAGRASEVWVDGANGAEALCTNLEALGVPRGYVRRMSTADAIAASQSLVDGLSDGTVAHSTKGQEALDEAAAVATRRPIGRSGGWGFEGSIELEACAAAVRAARGTKRDPTRRQQVLM